MSSARQLYFDRIVMVPTCSQRPPMMKCSKQEHDKRRIMVATRSFTFGLLLYLFGSDGARQMIGHSFGHVPFSH